MNKNGEILPKVEVLFVIFILSLVFNPIVNYLYLFLLVLIYFYVDEKTKENV
jgi:hypothetical protein